MDPSRKLMVTTLTVNVRRICGRLSANMWFSYLTILLLQFKVIWDMWRVRDLTSGDTSYYFLTAFNWYKNGTTLFTWSPLYTAFYGAFLHLSPDAAIVTITHRLVIVFVIAALVLAVMRKFLPNPIAWLMAAWWVVLPIDFNALYEVHLFGLIPLLVSLLVATNGERVNRAWALALLVATSVLMRNEIVVAAAAFAIVIAVFESSQRRTRDWNLLFRAYGLPFLAILLIAVFFYNRATDSTIMGSMVARKHSLNVCQIYAFGYQQRHPGWTQSPWTECQSLMMKEFGESEPSMIRAISANPAAMAEHFKWNALLLPNGLQVLLFDRMYGEVNPDYVPATTRSVGAAVLCLIVLSILILGGTSLLGQQRHLLRMEVDQRVWGWLMVGCLSAVTLLIAIMQRPRPSYMFILGIAIRLMVGFCLASLSSRLHILPWLESYFSILAVVMIMITPSYYVGQPSPVANSLSTLYGRLRPFEYLFEAPGVQFSAVGWVPEICNYLSKTTQGCKAASYFDYRKDVNGSSTLGEVLNKQGINLFYAEESIFADPVGREFITDPAASGWSQIASEEIPGRRWMLLKKRGWHNESAPSLAEIVRRDQGLSLGGQWYGFETFSGDTFRWVNNDADIRVGAHENNLKFLVLDVEPGPGMGQPLVLHITSHGADLMTERLLGRQSIRIPLSLASQNGAAIFRLHADGEGKATPTDSRILNFRVFSVALSPE